jgi:predicted enzyme related to lactoylglutathione lyase
VNCQCFNGLVVHSRFQENPICLGNRESASTAFEFASPEVEKTQAFFAKAFGWEFINYGDDYRDVQGAGIGAGIEKAALRAPLVGLEADDLEIMLAVVKDASAEISQEIFEFPGGRRFQFGEPGGNEIAVWTQEKSKLVRALFPGQLIAKTEAMANAEGEIGRPAGDTIYQAKYATAVM